MPDEPTMTPKPPPPPPGTTSRKVPRWVYLVLFVVVVALPFLGGLKSRTSADKEALAAIFSDTDKFTGATPFLFLLACVIVFAFGPGKLSLDALFGKKSAK